MVNTLANKGYTGGDIPNQLLTKDVLGPAKSNSHKRKTPFLMQTNSSLTFVGKSAQHSNDLIQRVFDQLKDMLDLCDEDQKTVDTQGQMWLDRYKNHYK